MNLILTVHSLLRWLVVLAALVAAVKYLAGWLGDLTYEPNDRRLGAMLAGLLDLQVVIGLLLLVLDGLGGVGFPVYRLEHAVTMLFAVAAVHLGIRRSDAPDRTRFRNGFIAVLVAILFVYVGIARLPQGWAL